jgi:hypothetical protein
MTTAPTTLPARSEDEHAAVIDASELEEHRADDSEDEAADDLHRVQPRNEPSRPIAARPRT